MTRKGTERSGVGKANESGTAREKSNGSRARANEGGRRRHGRAGRRARGGGQRGSGLALFFGEGGAREQGEEKQGAASCGSWWTGHDGDDGDRAWGSCVRDRARDGAQRRGRGRSRRWAPLAARGRRGRREKGEMGFARARVRGAPAGPWAGLGWRDRWAAAGEAGWVGPCGEEMARGLAGLTSLFSLLYFL